MTTGLTTADFIIIGGGIAGASAGYELCKKGKVILLERESQPGYHSTGRSAAVFLKSYGLGDPLLHALVTASEDFLTNPPAGFAAHPLLNFRPMIYISPKDQQDKLDDLFHKLSEIGVKVEFLEGPGIGQMMPILAPEYQERVLVEQGVADIDVNALQEGYFSAIKKAGGRIITDAEVTGLSKEDNLWQVTSSAGTFQAPIVINAAGAWVDEVADLANITPIHIQPQRRTMVVVPLAKDHCPDQWPFVYHLTEGFYFKPDAGKILITPGDAHLSPPTDAQPEELDIAYGVHYLEQATTLKVDKIDHSWAGLRNHVADGHPVVGFDPEMQGFFWLAAQGGFGIKTAPAMGRITASLIAGDGLPDDMLALGLTEDQISVKRVK